MIYEILNLVLTQYIHVTNCIDRLPKLKKSLKNIDSYDGFFDISLSNELSIVYRPNLIDEVFESTQTSSSLDEELKNSLLRINVRDYIYPAVVYRSKDGGSLWVRNGYLYAYSNQPRRLYPVHKFGDNADFSIDLESFTKEDMFALRISVQFEFEQDVLLEAIDCYKVLKKKRSNILYDILK